MFNHQSLNILQEKYLYDLEIDSDLNAKQKEIMRELYNNDCREFLTNKEAIK